MICGKKCLILNNLLGNCINNEKSFPKKNETVFFSNVQMFVCEKQSTIIPPISFFLKQQQNLLSKNLNHDC
jgi:hypothetical protein